MDEIIEQNKNKFNEFLKTKVSRESTVKQYLAWMNKIQNWFIEKKIVKDDFNIWVDVNEIPMIKGYLNDEKKSGWKATNKPLKNWMSSPWNAWVAFNENKDIEIEEDLDEVNLGSL